MATQKAIDFIVNLKYDRILRRKMSRLAPHEVHPFLETIGYSISPDQFDDAVNYYKLRCPTEQDALLMDEIRTWFKYITNIIVKGPRSQVYKWLTL